MKTLSVRFYKRLFLALLVFVPTVIAVILGVENARLRRQLAGEGSEIQFGSVQSREPLELVGETLAYQELYPELYSTATIDAGRLRETETVYLTFDCTPSVNTSTILDILDIYDVKATFFVNGTTDLKALPIMSTIVERGHSIGLRSYSDSYQQIYSSIEDYLDDFKAIYDLVYETTGVRAEIFRYPGGSINPYNSGIYQQLNAEMLRRNFVFFDWNISGGGQGEQTAAELRDNILSEMVDRERGIIALQDIPENEMVVNALPGIIDGLKDVGYAFQPLTAAVLPVIFI